MAADSLSDRQLNHLCRLYNVDGYKAMSRENKIAWCNPAKLIRQKATIRALRSTECKQKPTQKEQLACQLETAREEAEKEGRFICSQGGHRVDKKWTREQVDQCVREVALETPLWSRDWSDADLRALYRLQEIPGADAMRRKELVTQCAAPLYKETKKMSKAVLKKNCEEQSEKVFPPGLSLRKSDLASCYVWYKLKNWRQDKQNQYDDLQCEEKKQTTPYPYSDTFNDCPPLYRIDSKTGCCKPSLRAATRKQIHVHQAVTLFQSLINRHLEPRTEEETKIELATTSLTEEGKRLVLEDQAEANAELSEFFVENELENTEEEPQDLLLVTNIAKALHEEVKNQLQESVDIMKRLQKELEEETAKPITPEMEKEEEGLIKRTLKQSARIVGRAVWWTGKGVVSLGVKIVSVAWSLVKTLASAGIDFVKWMIKDPRTTKIVTFIALEIKRRFCRELSIDMGLTIIKEDATLIDRLSTGTKEAVAEGKKLVRLAVADGLRAFARGPWIDKLMTTLQEYVASGLGKVLGALGGVVGGTALALTTGGAGVSAGVTAGAAVGSVIGAGVDVCISAFTEGVKASIEVIAYQDDVTLTVYHVMELVNFNKCFQYVSVTKKELATRTSLATKAGKAVQKTIDWVNPWLSEESAASLKAFTDKSKRQLSAFATKEAYLAKYAEDHGVEAATTKRAEIDQTAVEMEKEHKARIAEAPRIARAQKIAEIENDLLAFRREQTGLVLTPERREQQARMERDIKIRLETEPDRAERDAKDLVRKEIESEALGLVLSSDPLLGATKEGRQLLDRVERDRRKRERFDRLHPQIDIPPLAGLTERGTRIDTGPTSSPPLPRTEAAPGGWFSNLFLG